MEEDLLADLLALGLCVPSLLVGGTLMEVKFDGNHFIPM